MDIKLGEDGLVDFSGDCLKGECLWPVEVARSEGFIGELEWFCGDGGGVFGSIEGKMGEEVVWVDVEGVARSADAGIAGAKDRVEIGIHRCGFHQLLDVFRVLMGRG